MDLDSQVHDFLGDVVTERTRNSAAFMPCDYYLAFSAAVYMQKVHEFTAQSGSSLCPSLTSGRHCEAANASLGVSSCTASSVGLHLSVTTAFS